MRVDTGEYAGSVEEAAQAAVRAERLGYDGWWSLETKHDPFLGCAVAAERTQAVTLGTSIAVAFARNPMTVAVQANDVQSLSKGRFVLGLGTQIKPHIEKRYSMQWSHPAPRMREFVLAVRAIWDAWSAEGKLDFRGDFYTHTLMTPFFDPGPNPYGTPKLMMAAVGPLMTQVAGEVADGMFCHAFSTERYLREVTLPALRRGAEKAGRSLEGFEISAPSFVVAADTEEQLLEGVAAVRSQIGFYGSTPAYRPVLEAHGWGDLQEELNTLTKRGAWDEIAGLIDDEILHTFAVIGTPEEAVEEVRRRYGDVTSRLTLPVPPDADPERWAPLFARLREPVAAGAAG